MGLNVGKVFKDWQSIKMRISWSKSNALVLGSLGALAVLLLFGDNVQAQNGLQERPDFVCADHQDFDCGIMAEEKWCKLNPQFMNWNCPVTCGYCVPEAEVLDNTVLSRRKDKGAIALRVPQDLRDLGDP